MVFLLLTKDALCQCEAQLSQLFLFIAGRPPPPPADQAVSPYNTKRVSLVEDLTCHAWRNEAQ